MNRCPSCRFQWDAHNDRMARECYARWLGTLDSLRVPDAMSSPAWSTTYRERVAA